MYKKSIGVKEIMDKEQVYHELSERMKNGKCPICEFAEYRINEAYDRFLYDGVNSPHLRYKIEKANGFCSFHAHKLREFNDQLTHAVLYHDFMHNVIENIGNKRNKIRYDKHDGCFFCENARNNENDYVNAFAEFFENEKFKSLYINGAALCVPHLTAIRNLRFKGKIADEITKITLEKYKRLNENLSEIKRKNDYRYTNEEWTREEKTAWSRAVDIFNGKNY